MGKYIGANHVHGTWFGGIDSSFGGVFQDEEVLIGSGLDYIPCVIGDISGAYILFGKNVAERQPHTFEDYSICMMKTIQDYFGDYSNIDERMDNYPDLDYIQDGLPMGKVSDLRGKNSAMCVERAALSQNLLTSIGINRFFKTSGIIKNENKEVHSYNLIEYQGKYYIFDSSMPNLIDDQVNPLIAEINKESFDLLSSPISDLGISVTVSHYNPYRDYDVTVTYDSNREKHIEVDSLTSKNSKQL